MNRPLETSVVIEASAGTGKTTQLVDRIVEVIAAGADVERIAAVTFTVAAAGEMKLRIGQKLEQAGQIAAVRRLERAFVGTIHAFCSNMLRQRPVEAGVDPGFEELAEPERVFARVFDRWLQEQLAAGSPVLRRCFARLAWRDERRGKTPVQSLRDSAWNLVEWRDYPGVWSRRNFDRNAELDSLLHAAEALASSLRPLADFADRVRRARDLGDFDIDTWEAELLSLPRVHRYLKPGSSQAWNQLKTAIESFRERADASLAVDLRDILWELVPRYEEAKHRAGQLDFLDLLIKTKGLLEQPGMQEYFQSRYEYLFVDEFQDTDPLQTEILTRLAGERAGRLFVVGDPKQSIYRFRRADVGSFEAACAYYASQGAQRYRLQTSHRSVQPIQDFVNAAFNAQMDSYLPLMGGREGNPKQPAVLALPIPEPYGKRNLSKLAINQNSPATVAAFIAWLVEKSGWTVKDPKLNVERPVEAKDVCILFRRFTNDGKDLTQDYVRCLEAQGLPHVLVGSKSFHHREEIAAIRTALRAIEWPDDELSVYATVRNFWGVLDGTLFLYKHKHGRLYPFMRLPADLEPEFAPVRDALEQLASLHDVRNNRPIAETIHSLLEPVRAFTAFSLRNGGMRVVANVQRLIETARSFELRHATSFRSFVLYLEEQSERGEASDAPVLEQEADGVKIMTVHKAKGLEFPVVILADLTAHLTGEGDRYVDGDRQLCAQRLLRWAPWDLLENLEVEAAMDRQEGVRVAYVAATRARDLLVVCAVGDKNFVERDDLFRGGWLAPLYETMYPHFDQWHSPRKRVQGRKTVLKAPPECSSDLFLAPGLHRGRSGDCDVWWFDPELLELKESADSGLDDKAILVGDPAEGLARYQAWRQWKQSLIEAARIPAFQTAIASEAAARAGDVTVMRIARSTAVKGSRRFGKVVHGILQHVFADHLEALSHAQAREHGANEEERVLALVRAREAMSHPLLTTAAQAKHLYREFPVMHRRADGALMEGRADLAFSDGTAWTVVDFKTGAADGRAKAQIRLYAEAIAEATGMPVQAVILEI